MVKDLFLESMFSVGLQYPLICACFLIGAVTMFLKDVITQIAVSFGSNAIVSFFCDLLISVGAYLLLFFSSLNYNNGIIRWFDLVSYIIGINVYNATLSKPFSFLISIVVRFLRCIYDYICGSIIRIFRVIFGAFDKTRSFVEYHISDRINSISYSRKLNCYTAFASKGFCLFDK